MVVYAKLPTISVNKVGDARGETMNGMLLTMKSTHQINMRYSHIFNPDDVKSKADLTAFICLIFILAIRA